VAPEAKDRRLHTRSTICFSSGPRRSRLRATRAISPSAGATSGRSRGGGVGETAGTSAAAWPSAPPARPSSTSAALPDTVNPTVESVYLLF